MTGTRSNRFVLTGATGGVTPAPG